MNLYFLLEDSRSFFKVLPHWLKFALPDFIEIFSLDDFYSSSEKNKFLIQSGFGYPQIKKVLKDTLETIQNNSVPINYFLVFWDTDARNIADIQADIDDFEKIFADYDLDYQHKLFVMNRCFETWLLGNRSAYPKNSESGNFYNYSQFYNVSTSDPEKMNAPEFISNISLYHLKYLQEMLRCSLHMNYSKKSPLGVSTREYYGELLNRVKTTEDLRSLADFFDFIESIRHFK